MFVFWCAFVCTFLYLCFLYSCPLCCVVIIQREVLQLYELYEHLFLHFCLYLCCAFSCIFVYFYSCPLCCIVIIQREALQLYEFSAQPFVIHDTSSHTCKPLQKRLKQDQTKTSQPRYFEFGCREQYFVKSA